MSRILIVDDDVEIQVILRTVLARAGHETFLTEDGEEALRQCRRKAIEVVITDLQLPNVHGLELIMLLRGLSPPPAIIAISGTGSAQLDMAQALGATVTLIKPVDPDELLSAVAEAVAGQA